MKKILSSIVLLLLTCSFASAGSLKVGDTATDFSFVDADGVSHSMETWPDRVLFINYVDPDEADTNEPMNEAMREARNNGLLFDDDYMGVGIVDCAATWKPNVLIRTIAGNKAAKYKRTVLFDYEATLRKAWDLKEDSANIILLDKDHVVRFISKGKVPAEQIDSVVNMAINLQ